jgi:hypothetical protein
MLIIGKMMKNLSKLINFVELTFNRRKYFGKDKGFVQR